MTEDLPPAYRQTVDHLLFDPRPAPRHRLRSGAYPRRPSELSPRKEPTVAYDDERDGPLPPSRQVYDPELGSDGGGWGGGALPSIDPDAPVAHVDELSGRRDPAMTSLPEPRSARDGLVACPTCGTGVDPDRIRR